MVSIIIPAFNVQEYLRECLESVLAQSFSDIEVIIVNDGSTDSTPTIAHEFAGSDNRVTVIDQENQGLSAARNAGIEHSAGEYIVFLDSDDTLFPDSIQILFDTLTATGSDIAVAGFTCHKTATRQDRTASTVYTLSPSDAIETILYQTDTRSLNNSAWGKIYRRQIFDSVRFTPGLYFEDIDFFYRAFLTAKAIGVSNATVYFYRTTPKSILRTFSPKRFDVLGITEMMEHAFAKNQRLLAAARSRRFSSNCNIFALLHCRHEASTYKAVADECWNLIEEYRGAILRNRKVRLKNKAGALLSYLGRNAFILMSRVINKP